MGKAVYVTNLSLFGILLFHKAPWSAISCRGTSPKWEAVAICNSVTLQTSKTTAVRTLIDSFDFENGADGESCHLHDQRPRSVHVERQPHTVAL